MKQQCEENFVVEKSKTSKQPFKKQEMTNSAENEPQSPQIKESDNQTTMFQKRKESQTTNDLNTKRK